MEQNETWMEQNNRLVRGTTMYGALKRDEPIDPAKDIDILLVSYDKKQKVMLVGRKVENDRTVKIANVFRGEDATVLYRSLINKQPRNVESVMVSMDLKNQIMLIGRQVKNTGLSVNIINKFANDAAQVIYDKLTKEPPREERDE